MACACLTHDGASQARPHSRSLLCNAVNYCNLPPRGTSLAVVKRLHDAFKQAMEQDNYKTALARYDMVPMYMSTEAYARFAQGTFAREKALVDKLGLGKAGYGKSWIWEKRLDASLIRQAVRAASTAAATSAKPAPRSPLVM